MDLGDVRQERLHRLPDLGVGDASLGLEHDVADLAGSLPAELGIEDVRAALALDAGQSEVVSIVGADGSHHAAQHDDRGEPDDQDGAPPPVARRRESADERVHDGIVRPLGRTRHRGGDRRPIRLVPRDRVCDPPWRAR
jgi:hypothetical protein